jgi:hypothetical protein
VGSEGPPGVITDVSDTFLFKNLESGVVGGAFTIKYHYGSQMGICPLFT